MLKSSRFHSNELENGQETDPVKLYCLRCCTHLGTGRFSTFHPMPAIMQWDKDIKLLGNHSIGVIGACGPLFSALTRYLVKPGLKRSCTMTNTVSNYTEISHGSGALASVARRLAHFDANVAVDVTHTVHTRTALSLKQHER